MLEELEHFYSLYLERKLTWFKMNRSVPECSNGLAKQTWWLKSKRRKMKYAFNLRLFHQRLVLLSLQQSKVLKAQSEHHRHQVESNLQLLTTRYYRESTQLVMAMMRLKAGQVHWYIRVCLNRSTKSLQHFQRPEGMRRLIQYLGWSKSTVILHLKQLDITVRSEKRILPQLIPHGL